MDGVVVGGVHAEEGGHQGEPCHPCTSHGDHHVNCKIEAKEKIKNAKADNKDDEERICIAKPDDIANNEETVDSNDKTAEANGEDFRNKTIDKVISHNLGIAGEGDCGDYSKGEH